MTYYTPFDMLFGDLISLPKGVTFTQVHCGAPGVAYIKKQEDNTVVVRWTDGTVTPVRCEEGEKFDMYTAFCAALAKKIYGSTSKVKKLIESHDVDAINAKKESDKMKREEERKRVEQLNHDKKIRRLAKKLLEEEEVRKYIESMKDDEE